MRSQLRLSSIVLLCALVLSVVPAAMLVQPAAASACDWAQFVADVTVPDGTRYAPGTTFQKTWRLKNIGTCTWTTGYSLVFDSGDRFGAQDVNLPINVAPGQTVDLTLNMTAPATVGHYFSFWKLKNASGVLFGIGSTANKTFWAEINVTTTSGTAFDFTAQATNAIWSSGAGALGFPGTDGSANGFALKLDAPKFESGVTFSQAGLLFAPNNVTNGFIQAIYPAFRVQTGDRFQATIGCQFGSTACYVAYRLDYQIGTGAVKTFWTFREKYEGLTFNANLNLSSLAGNDVKFILVISAFGSPVGDRALWGNPVIARAGGTIPPTTPAPTTPAPAACDRAQFIADVNVPDGTVFAPTFAFTKTWRLKNVGTCTWAKDTYQLIFDSGQQMGGPNTAPMPTSVAPGQTVDITISLTSPGTAGTYRGYWKFKNASGIPFGIGLGGTKSWWVEIKVSSTGTVPPTSGTPAAGTQYDFATNACSAAWFSGAGQLPCPGTDGDSKGFVLKVANPKLEDGTTDSRPGLITFPQNVNNGYIQGYFPPYMVKAGDRFRSIVNCENGATSCYVIFRLDYQIGNGSVQNFWIFGEKYEGKFFQADLSLAPLVGQNVKFVLTVLSAGSPVGDRALWVGPIIYNASSAATATTPAPTTAASATPTLPLTATPSLTPTVPSATPTGTPTPTNTPPTPAQ